MKPVLRIAAIATAALPAMAGATVTFADGSFETQAASTATNGSGFRYFKANCDAGAWTGANNAGLQIETNTAWPGAQTPAGGFYGFVQINGTLSQTFTSTSTTGSTLSWLAAGRPAGCCGGNQTYDNVAFGAVPKPTTWGMMALGFGLVGAAMRRRRAALVAA